MHSNAVIDLICVYPNAKLHNTSQRDAHKEQEEEEPPGVKLSSSDLSVLFYFFVPNKL